MESELTMFCAAVAWLMVLVLTLTPDPSCGFHRWSEVKLNKVSYTDIGDIDYGVTDLGGGFSTFKESVLSTVNFRYKRNNPFFILAAEWRTSSIPLKGYWKGHGSLTNQPKYVLWIWRGVMTMSLEVSLCVVGARTSQHCWQWVRHFPSLGGTLPELALVTTSVLDFYGQQGYIKLY